MTDPASITRVKYKGYKMWVKYQNRHEMLTGPTSIAQLEKGDTR
jgi:hypothetical protein